MSDDIGRTVMWFTFGLAGFVLLIACANLANLQLVRTAARARELAVRAALGAGRWRLLRHSFTESILVALIGGIISLVVAFGAIRFISVRMFNDLPGASVQLDYKVFGFALLCSLLTGVLFGTLPAWLASRADLNLVLRENSRGSSAGRSQHRLRHTLIVGEVAFAMVLLAAAGLFLRGLQPVHSGSALLDTPVFDPDAIWLALCARQPWSRTSIALKGIKALPFDVTNRKMGKIYAVVVPL